MSKEQFILICNYLEKVLVQEHKIEQVLDVYFEGNNSFGNLVYDFVVEFFNLATPDEYIGEIITSHILDILYDKQTFIYQDETGSSFLLCSTYSELYDFYIDKLN